MEEEKNEIDMKSSTKTEFFGPFNHCNCSRHKMARCLLRVLLGLIIFSIGVCVGSHRGLEHGDRFERAYFKHNGNCMMMQGNFRTNNSMMPGNGKVIIQRQGGNVMWSDNDGDYGYQVQGEPIQTQPSQAVTQEASQTIIKVNAVPSTATVPKK